MAANTNTFNWPDLQVHSDAPTVTGALSARLYLSGAEINDLQPWQTVSSDEKEFRKEFYWGNMIGVNPQETWTLTGGPGHLIAVGLPQSPMTAKLKVFYGGAAPKESTFRVVFKTPKQ